MLANLSKSRQLVRLAASSSRQFAALNASDVSLDSMNPKDIHDSTPKAVGSVMAAMINDTQDRSQICDEIDEFFRKNFRKISFEDARDVIKGIGSQQNSKSSKIVGLDDKFWVWETLEEATRPRLGEIAEEEWMQFTTGWAINMKGSEELHDLMFEKSNQLYAVPPPFTANLVSPRPSSDH